MHVDVVSTGEGLAGLTDEWLSLEQRDSGANYYVLHRFVRAWWAAYAEDPKVALRVLTVRDNGLVGILPLSIRQESEKGRQLRVLRFATFGDFMAPLIDPSASADAVCKKLMSAVEADPEWDRMDLTGIPADSPFATFLLKSSYNPAFKFQVENPYIDLAGCSSIDDLAASMPSHLNKYRNKLFRERDVRFVVVRGNEDGIVERIAALHQLEKRHLTEVRSRQGRRSLFENDRRMQHVRNAFDQTQDAITFGYVDPAGELIGYRTCYLHGRTLLSWNSAYHPDYYDYRIGKVIQYDVLSHMLEHDLADVFDFGAGRYSWKFEWSGKFSSTYRLRVDRPSAVARPSPPEPEEQLPAELPATRRAVGWGKARSAVRRTGGRVVRRLRPPVIFYAPHPDDETIFMGGSIRAHRRRRVVLVVLSRGGASKALGKVSARLEQPLSREQFMRARVRELTAAVRRLGIEHPDLIVHDLPDGGFTIDAVKRIMTEMARRHPGATHRTMSWLDPHPDHSTAGSALSALHSEKVIESCQFHLPIPLFGSGLGTAVDLDPEAHRAKRAALREYKRWNPDRGRFAIGWHSVERLIRDQQRDPAERVHGPDFEHTP